MNTDSTTAQDRAPAPTYASASVDCARPWGLVGWGSGGLSGGGPHSINEQPHRHQTMNEEPAHQAVGGIKRPGHQGSSVRGRREGNNDLVALLREGQLARILKLPEDAPPLLLVGEVALERLGGVNLLHLGAQHGAIEGAPLLKRDWGGA